MFKVNIKTRLINQLKERSTIWCISYKYISYKGKMKKTLAIILLIIAFLIIYFLQANFFNWFTIAGVKPNFFIVFILFISLYAGVKVGIPFGVISGLFLDIILGKNLGTYGIMFGIIGIIGGYFDKNFSKESKITIILMVIGSTFIFEIGSYIIQIIEQSINVEIMDFIRILLIEAMYNTILTIIFYPLIQKLGYKVEETFKVQRILTRYF